jgi:hypothetical protein
MHVVNVELIRESKLSFNLVYTNKTKKGSSINNVTVLFKDFFDDITRALATKKVTIRERVSIKNDVIYRRPLSGGKVSFIFT